MSLIHYLRVGRFAKEDCGWVRFERLESGAYRAVPSEPFTPEEIEEAVGATLGDVPQPIPDEWSAWYDDGTVLADEYAAIPETVDLFERLSRLPGVQIIDTFGQPGPSTAEWRQCLRPRRVAAAV